MLRTHTCGEITEKSTGKKVVLAGWVQSSRDHGGVIFIDLRDRYGITQIVCDPSHDKTVHAMSSKLGREYVIRAHGKVRGRPEGMTNPKLSTGMIEVLVDKLEVLSESETPPFEIDDRAEVSEELRLKYRYLDLRRPVMRHHLEVRHRAAQAARKYFSGLGFLEIETPMLVKSTPEGARDYVVPSRVHPGKFYALPQSPQLYKQILQVAGMDRYFQIARCLRDEDLRADRQPEHTQIDVEMSFVTRDDLFETFEGLMKSIFKEAADMDIKIPFQRLSHREAMEKYGTDKPDLRYSLGLTDVTEIVSDSDFDVFRKVIQGGGIVKCINPKGELTRNEIDDLIKFCQGHGAKGMAWMRVTEKGLESNIAKFFSESTRKKLIDAVGAEPNSTIMFIADKESRANDVLDRLRQELARRLKLLPENQYKFCWVTDFPLFEWNEDEQRWEPCHHMFTMPHPEDVAFLEKYPGKVRCSQYDLVLNGIELGSGSIRITDPKIQEAVMNVIGIGQDEARKRFGFLLDAFRYGVPPHGGIGLGFDRIVAMMLGFSDIREVIAFPRNKAAENPMDDSPSDIEDRQLKELHLKFDMLKK
ncbi:aspartate--tRNA ligase [Candidatus Woesearchaeota archaeon]|nr:aspartate--tRNA ligase [Candidatus Woesearchaeota archaeon]